MTGKVKKIGEIPYFEVLQNEWETLYPIQSSRVRLIEGESYNFAFVDGMESVMIISFAGNNMTSVEWLKEKLWNEFNFTFSDNIFQQAKEMHKKEIIDTWEKADTFPQGYYNAEHYYNETFKKD
jgi:hypothetical protein